MRKTLPVALSLLMSQAAFAEVVVLQGATLIDGTGRPPLKNAVLVIDAGRISAVGPADKVKAPPGARALDLKGRTIIPGLINAHGHVGLVVGGQSRADGYTRENVQTQLLQYERYGVTSVLTLGLNRDLVYDVRDEQRRGTVPGATLFTAGRGIGVPDGAPPVPSAPDQVYRPRTPEEAVANVEEAAARKPDYFKIWVDDVFGKFPKMDPAVFKAAIDAAHRHSIKVASHVFYLGDAKAVITSGVDALAHSVRDQPVDDELVAMMKKRGTFYVATLNVDASFSAFADDPALLDDPFLTAALPPDSVQQFRSPEYRAKVAADPNVPKARAALENGMRNLKTLHARGVHIAFGTDSGANPVRIQGWGEHRELELMVKAGLSPMDALVAATRGSATMLGISDRGTLEKGKRADLLVLAGNPLDDIRNTRKLVSVWHDGREIQPLVASASAR
ncbi:MAG: amidohydrolase family protein [Deltaproteobacteria bacterium]|nr:MAG: amidohydrolase family protein [Deltaproteobacteria bacterium]